MSLRLDYADDEKLYSDNTFVGRTQWGNYYFSIYITENGASICRYCVPGRIDTYNFDWIPSRSSGVGDRLAYFTDTSASLNKALTLVKRDLKKKQVKQLLKDVKAKYARTYLDPLLEALR